MHVIAVTFHLITVICICSCYTIPKPRFVRLHPRGFQVSISDEPGNRLFVFHGQMNERIRGSAPGTIHGDILAPIEGAWTYTNTNIEIGAADVLHYWIHVQNGFKEYRLYEQQITRNGMEDASGTNGSSTAVSCRSSISRLAGRTMCSGELLFDENFQSMSSWNTETLIPTDSHNAEFVSYQDFPEVCKAEDGIFVIKPQLLNECCTGGSTTLDLSSRCTAPSPAECIRNVFSYNILPPAVSCRVHTKPQFAFKYGRIEIRAKLPIGDWMYPDIRLINSDTLDSEMKREGSAAEQANLGIIQIAFSRSNAQLTSGADGVEIGGRVLYGGISKDITQLANLTLDTHFGDVYHVYSAKWTDTSVQFAVDGQTYGQYDISKTDAFLHQEHHLALGIGVGGVVYFPEGSRTGPERTVKPWQNDDPKAEWRFAQNKPVWRQTWSASDSALSVDYVRVYAI